MMNKPQFSQLLGWLEGELTDAEARLVEQQLETADAASLADLSWLRDFLGAAELARGTSPPPELGPELVRRFKEFRKMKRSPSIMERLAATLSFDSDLQLATSGARSGPALGKQRQLIYDSDLAEVAVNIHPRSQDSNLTLTGQIYPKKDFSAEGLSIQILLLEGPETEAGLAASDELGEFTLESIPQGRYGIIISAESFEIVLQDVYLQR